MMDVYVQITTRCNMHCEHCGFACTSKGTDMTMKTFRNTLKYLEKVSPWDDTWMTLGGGEPTLHKDFLKMLQEAFTSKLYRIGTVTNGSNKELALLMLAMSDRNDEFFSVRLSRDYFHDAIDQAVVTAYERKNQINKLNTIVKSGRAKQNYLGEERCFCDTLLIKPSGKVKACGCHNAPVLGNINDPNLDIHPMYTMGTCYKHAAKEYYDAN